MASPYWARLVWLEKEPGREKRDLLEPIRDFRPNAWDRRPKSGIILNVLGLVPLRIQPPSAIGNHLQIERPGQALHFWRSSSMALALDPDNSDVAR